MKHRLLLDTQTFIYAAQEGGSLSAKARAALLHSGNTLFLSLVSLWEIQIKLTLGKLKLPTSLPKAVQQAITEIGIELLPLQADHIYKLTDLPLHHRDPFDRLLIGQALIEKMVVVGNDLVFDSYGVPRIW